MSIPRLSTFNSAFSVHKEYVYNYLSHNLKKNSLIVAIALSCLAACYLIKKIVQNWACKKNLNTNPPDQNRIASASEPILKKKEESEQPNPPSTTSPIATDEISEPFPFLKLPLAMQSEVYSFIELKKLLTYKSVSTQVMESLESDYLLRLPILYNTMNIAESFFYSPEKNELSYLNNIINHRGLQSFLTKDGNINFLNQFLNWLGGSGSRHTYYYEKSRVLGVINWDEKDKKIIQTVLNLFFKYAEILQLDFFINTICYWRESALKTELKYPFTVEFFLNGLSEERERRLLDCRSSTIETVVLAMSLTNKINKRFLTAIYKKNDSDSLHLLYRIRNSEIGDPLYVIKGYILSLDLISLLKELDVTPPEKNDIFLTRLRSMVTEYCSSEILEVSKFFFSSVKSLTMDQVKALAWALVEANYEYTFLMHILEKLKSIKMKQSGSLKILYNEPAFLKKKGLFDVDKILAPLLKECVFLNRGKKPSWFDVLVNEISTKEQMKAFIEAIKCYPHPVRIVYLRLLILKDGDEAIISSEERRNIFTECQLDYGDYEWISEAGFCVGITFYCELVEKANVKELFTLVNEHFNIKNARILLRSICAGVIFSKKWTFKPQIDPEVIKQQFFIKNGFSIESFNKPISIEEIVEIVKSNEEPAES